MSEVSREQILAMLEPLFEEAESKGLWFHCNYQDIWFSPAELRAEHAKGQFIWGPVNWNLRNPKENLASLRNDLRDAERAIKDFQERL